MEPSTWEAIGAVLCLLWLALVCYGLHFGQTVQP